MLYLFATVLVLKKNIIHVFSLIYYNVFSFQQNKFYRNRPLILTTNYYFIFVFFCLPICGLSLYIFFIVYFELALRGFGGDDGG